MVVSTGYSGNWYSIVGTVSEVRDELNRINVLPHKVITAGKDGTGSSAIVTVFVARP